MNCPTHQELTDLFLGNIPDEQAADLYAHIALCDSCCDYYTSLAQQHTQSIPRDIAPSVLHNIQKGPITRRKLLAIYAVAAACVMIMVTSGSMDKLMTATQQIQTHHTEWSEKINYTTINQIWEELNHGIQN